MAHRTLRDPNPVPGPQRIPAPAPSDALRGVLPPAVAGAWLDRLMNFADARVSHAPAVFEVRPPALLMGVLDITDELQRALDAGCARVRLPAGRMTVRSTIRLGPGQRIVGMGGGLGAPATSVLLRGPSPAFDLTDADGAGLEDFTVLGGGQGVAIHLEGTSRSSLQGVGVRAFTRGVELTGENGLVLLEQCRFEDCDVGVSVSRASTGVRVFSCTFRHCRTAGLQTDGKSTLVLASSFEEPTSENTMHIHLGRTAEASGVRYNDFGGAATPVESLAQPTGAAAHLIEHNAEEGAPSLEDGRVQASVLRGVAGRSGESAWNRLVNGSFEWPESAVGLEASTRTPPAHWEIFAGADGAGVPVGIDITRVIFQQGDANAYVDCVQDLTTLRINGCAPEVECRDACGPPGEPPVVNSLPDIEVFLGPAGVKIPLPPARDGIFALRLRRDAGRANVPREVALRGLLTPGLARTSTHDAQCVFSGYFRLVSGRASVRLVLIWTGGEARSDDLAPLSLAAPDASVWRRVVCRAPVSVDEPSLLAEIRVSYPAERGNALPVDAVVDLDGMQLNAGWHIMEPDDAPITENGGRILGPVKFNEGAEPRVRLEAPFVAGADGLPVALFVMPFDARLVALQTMPRRAPDRLLFTRLDNLGRPIEAARLLTPCGDPTEYSEGTFIRVTRLSPFLAGERAILDVSMLRSEVRP